MRKEKGVSLKEVANSVGLAESQLSYYENGKREPREKETWGKLADYFNVSVGYLMGVSNQRVSEEKALEVAREVYQSYLLDNNLDKDIRNAFEYFNTDDLDSILQQAMQSYFTVPAVKENEDWQSLEATYFLHAWLEGYLVDRYRKEVETNQNLITNTYYNIPSADDINEYGLFHNEIQIPINKEYPFFQSLEEYPEIYEEIKKLINLDTTLIAYNYEGAIDEELKNELNEILEDTRSKILNLKEKYPNKTSKIEQSTILVTRDKNNSHWTREGEYDSEDKLNLSEPTKQVFVELASALIEEMKKIKNGNK